jgi:hypothetical protein
MGAIAVFSRTGGQEWDLTQVIQGAEEYFGVIAVMSDDGLTLATTGQRVSGNVVTVTPYLYSRSDGQGNFTLLGPVGPPPGFPTPDFATPALGASAEQGIFVAADTYSYIYTWTAGTSNGTYRIIVGENGTNMGLSSAMSSDGIWTAAGDTNAPSFAGLVHVGLCEPPKQGSQCSLVQQLLAPDSLTSDLAGTWR